ncbi:uncharacterized protein LOC129941939 [Eupeodes corollae]|uniref:uncharacterized protein LOC129941939 n=1 Tax=Eupeodes corollae TaxID=290404 RepID=UPI00249137E4|nr:uncharacterized protein LOC129941939 [Eupeodes corollae]
MASSSSVFPTRRFYSIPDDGSESEQDIRMDPRNKKRWFLKQEEFLAVDEQTIPTKCRHELKLYNPKKPEKWGYKNLVLSGVSGLGYDLDLFDGDKTSGTFDQNGTASITNGKIEQIVAPTEKKMRKKGGGYMIERVADIDGEKVSFVSWYDNKVVNMVSTFV